MLQKVTHSPAQTEAFGEALGRCLKGGEILAYSGGMGMGKTAFTRGLARGMGITASVSSPTFALVHAYEGAVPLYHFDMYRVESLDDLYSTGFFDYLDTDSVLAIEWSENIDGALPDNTIRLSFEVGETEQDRIITLQAINEEAYRCVF